MFQLIIAVVSIALIAGLSVCAIMYGGQIFTAWNERAVFVKYLTQGGQIESGLRMYRTKNNAVPVPAGDCAAQGRGILCQLQASEYLSAIPAGGWEIEPTGSNIYKPLQDLAQCRRLNEYRGMNMGRLAAFEGLPLDSPAFTGCPPCTTPPEAANYNASLEFRTWPGCRHAI